MVIGDRTYDFNDDLKSEILQFTHGMNSYDFLFTSRSGQKSKPISRIRANQFLKNAADEVGLETISFHALRKTFG